MKGPPAGTLPTSGKTRNPLYTQASSSTRWENSTLAALTLAPTLASTQVSTQVPTQTSSAYAAGGRPSPGYDLGFASLHFLHILSTEGRGVGLCWATS